MTYLLQRKCFFRSSFEGQKMWNFEKAKSDYKMDGGEQFNLICNCRINVWEIKDNVNFLKLLTTKLIRVIVWVRSATSGKIAHKEWMNTKVTWRKWIGQSAENRFWKSWKFQPTKLNKLSNTQAVNHRIYGQIIMNKNKTCCTPWTVWWKIADFLILIS